MTLTALRYVLYLVTFVSGIFFGWSTTPDELTAWVKGIALAALVAFGFYIAAKWKGREVDEELFPLITVNVLLWVGGAALSVWFHHGF
ncbi:hypothetical protein [Deinococcus aestuarii]|uniref:hypothetical protein n=1 Tax=Deinococcus aestuarii TaxID=2774531 RepID=UPI001C0B92ED|nr:hypothetical protein [Deinococcus aestuarii]